MAASARSQLELRQSTIQKTGVLEGGALGGSFGTVDSLGASENASLANLRLVQDREGGERPDCRARLPLRRTESGSSRKLAGSDWIVRGPKLSGRIVGASEPTGSPALAEADLVWMVNGTRPCFGAIA